MDIEFQLSIAVQIYCEKSMCKFKSTFRKIVLLLVSEPVQHNFEQLI